MRVYSHYVGDVVHVLAHWLEVFLAILSIVCNFGIYLKMFFENTFFLYLLYIFRSHVVEHRFTCTDVLADQICIKGRPVNLDDQMLWPA
jgi:hypothetical protein